MNSTEIPSGILYQVRTRYHIIAVRIYLVSSNGVLPYFPLSSLPCLSLSLLFPLLPRHALPSHVLGEGSWFTPKADSSYY